MNDFRMVRYDNNSDGIALGNCTSTFQCVYCRNFKDENNECADYPEDVLHDQNCLLVQSNKEQIEYITLNGIKLKLPQLQAPQARELVGALM